LAEQIALPELYEITITATGIKNKKNARNNRKWPNHLTTGPQYRGSESVGYEKTFTANAVGIAEQTEITHEMPINNFVRGSRLNRQLRQKNPMTPFFIGTTGVLCKIWPPKLFF